MSADQLAPAGEPVRCWLRKRGLAVAVLEEYLGLPMDEIERAINNDDPGVTLPTACFLDVPPKRIRSGFCKRKLPSDMGMVDWKQAGRALDHLAKRLIKAKYFPTAVLVLEELGLPGSLATAGLLLSRLRRRYEKLGKSVAFPNLVVVPAGDGRKDKRRVADRWQSPSDLQRVLIVSDVILSCKHVRSLVDAIRCAHPQADIRCAALFVGDFVAHTPVAADSLGCYFYSLMTSRAKVFVPWGDAACLSEIELFEHPAQKDHRIEDHYRPWGRYREFLLNQTATVRILTVYPNQRMSEQRHKHRDELFVALDDGLRLKIGDRWIEPRKDTYILIPRECWHRIGTVDDVARPVRVLEVAFGVYDQVGDIERKADDYGRADMDGAV